MSVPSVSNKKPSPPAASATKRPSIFSTWASLTKLKLTAMATLPAILAYLAASSEPHPLPILVLASGVFFSASGAAALNQWTERHSDRRMNRTRERPLPAGHLSPTFVFTSGLALVCAGSLLLGVVFNPLAALLTVAAGGIYWLAYTPLKRITPWCTEVGAVSGAIPCLIGWAAAEGELAPFAWFLFAILFLWQMPHFHPIAWRHREDYARAGLRMRAVAEPTGNSAANHSIAYAIVLIPVSIAPFFNEQIGIASFSVAAILGAFFLFCALRFRFSAKRDVAARQLFRFSLLYLPAVLTTLAAERCLTRFFDT